VAFAPYSFLQFSALRASQALRGPTCPSSLARLVYGRPNRRHHGRGKGKGRRGSPPTGPPSPPGPQFTVVIHAVPTKYRTGEVRRWLEEDNQHLHIAGTRCLLAENRRAGKTHSSMVLYLEDPTIKDSLRLGRKILRTTTYDWER